MIRRKALQSAHTHILSKSVMYFHQSKSGFRFLSSSSTSSSKSKEKVIIALSGGVDSSVAAYLLNEKISQQTKHHYPQKVHLSALFMNNWNVSDEMALSSSSSSRLYCQQSEQDFRDAQSVCDMLSIKLHYSDFSAEYWEKVFEPFVSSIIGGECNNNTISVDNNHNNNEQMPNPDIYCNSQIKFGAMKKYAHETLGATYIATGHYARLWNRSSNTNLTFLFDDDENGSGMPSCVENGLQYDFDNYRSNNEWIETWGSSSTSSNILSSDENDLLPLLLSAKDTSKDQSYFLSHVKSFQNVIFPLGNLMKSSQSNNNHSEIKNRITSLSVRDIALEAELPNANKRESMGICFIGKRKFNDFISDYIEENSSINNEQNQSGREETKTTNNSPHYDRSSDDVEFICIDTGAIVGYSSSQQHQQQSKQQRGRSSFNPLLLTIGQGAKISGASQKWFVCGKNMILDDADNNKNNSNNNSRGKRQIFVCNDTNHPALYSDELSIKVNQFNWIGSMEMPPALRTITSSSSNTDNISSSFRAYCRIRHLQPLIPCTISL